ncbi:cell cycle checkpoint control protein Rad9 isoform X2 [Calliopsis andreniformis]|uniref:cell cycle checkpoint control protein Rad9 isoform X2 n=1 Tax=Calliopsis andreniformis TaxID=337506 RepID=UPI003FCEB8A9
MKCVVPGVNVKILAKAIHALAKIGDEMFIEPQENALSFRTVNMANSAYADFTLFQSYFSYYNYGDLQENDTLKCKISMRSAMTVFKAPNLIDKQVETCHIRLESNAAEILFILKYKNSITKTHLLPILECEVLQIQYDKDGLSNQLSSQSRVLGDALQNFQQNLIEITLEVSSQKLLLRNYVDDTSGKVCQIQQGHNLPLAEENLIGIPVSIYFEEPGKPAIFALKNPSFEANLVLSTLNSENCSQSETTLVVPRQEKSKQRRAVNKRVSKRSNKSTTKIETKSMKMNKTSGNATSSNMHSNFMERKNETDRDFLTENSDVPLNVSDKNVTNNSNKNQHSISAAQQNNLEESHNYASTSRNIVTKRSEASTSDKALVNSVFSSISKRKSSKKEANKKQSPNNNNSDILEDAIPNSPSPPAKKARLIFQKCFQKTFDPTTLPGYDVILAEDSDECCSE